MVDCLDCLRHDTVICGYYKDCDIGGLGTAHTHGCEGFVSRCIQECDCSAFCLYRVGTDMLGDPSGLTGSDTGGSNRIQKRGFTVINVSHNAYNRRSGHKILCIFFIFVF